MELREALRRPRIVAAAGCFALGAAVLIVMLWQRALPPQPELAPAVDLAPFGDAAPLPPPLAGPAGDAPAELIVYVTGAVARPDVYRLAPGARAKDAVVAAGGLAPDAAAELVNLAAPLADAAHVHIPGSAEAAAPAAAGPAGAASSLLDLNTASAADLEELPGIGTTIAGRIIARRTEQGPYTAVEELREVTGVGEKLYAQIAPLVTAGP